VTKTFRRRNDLKLRRPKVLMIPFILKVLQPADGWEDSFQIWRRVLALLLAQSLLKKRKSEPTNIKYLNAETCLLAAGSLRRCCSIRIMYQ